MQLILDNEEIIEALNCYLRFIHNNPELTIQDFSFVGTRDGTKKKTLNIIYGLTPSTIITDGLPLTIEETHKPEDERTLEEVQQDALMYSDLIGIVQKRESLGAFNKYLGECSEYIQKKVTEHPMFKDYVSANSNTAIDEPTEGYDSEFLDITSDIPDPIDYDSEDDFDESSSFKNHPTLRNIKLLSKNEHD